MGEDKSLCDTIEPTDPGSLDEKMAEAIEDAEIMQEDPPTFLVEFLEEDQPRLARKAKRMWQLQRNRGTKIKKAAAYTVLQAGVFSAFYLLHKSGADVTAVEWMKDLMLDSHLAPYAFMADNLKKYLGAGPHLATTFSTFASFISVLLHQEPLNQRVIYNNQMLPALAKRAREEFPELRGIDDLAWQDPWEISRTTISRRFNRVLGDDGNKARSRSVNRLHQYARAELADLCRQARAYDIDFAAFAENDDSLIRATPGYFGLPHKSEHAAQNATTCLYGSLKSSDFAERRIAFRRLQGEVYVLACSLTKNPVTKTMKDMVQQKRLWIVPYSRVKELYDLVTDMDTSKPVTVSRTPPTSHGGLKS